MTKDTHHLEDLERAEQAAGVAICNDEQDLIEIDPEEEIRAQILDYADDGRGCR